MKNGATVGVIVTHVVSPMDLYVVCRLEEYEYYVNMHEEMQQMYNKDICNIYSLFYPRADMLCAAKGSDGEWHRAKVLTSPLHKEVGLWSCDQLKLIIKADNDVHLLFRIFANFNTIVN